MKKHWITFDLDGTLMQNPFVEWVFPEITAIVEKETAFEGDIRKQLISEHNRRMGKNLIVEAYDWDNILKEVLLRNEIEININVETLVKKHSISPKVYLLEEKLIEALNELKNNGYLLAVVTNGYSNYQLPVLNTLGLTPLFDCIMTPEKEGYAKPNIKMVERFSRANKVIAHVGDRIDHDVIFANDLDVTSVLINRKLPENLKAIKPDQRNRNQEIINIVKEKHYKETGLKTENINNQQYIPTIVIHSIHELLDSLN